MQAWHQHTITTLLMVLPFFTCGGIASIAGVADTEYVAEPERPTDLLGRVVNVHVSVYVCE